MNEELLKLLMQMVGATNNPAMNTLSTKLKDYFKNQQGSKAFALNADPLSMIDPYRVNSAWSYQKGGGAVNTTGYTPGYPSMNNPFNIIPGGNITMKDTPFNVLGIPMYGNKLGIPQLMNPGQNYNFPGAKGVLEIPQMQRGGPIHPFIEAIRKMFSKNDVVDNPIPPGTMLPEVNLYGHRDKETNDYLNVMAGKNSKYTEQELEERRKKALNGQTVDSYLNKLFNEKFKEELEWHKRRGLSEKEAILESTYGTYSADSFDKIDKKQFITSLLKSHFPTIVPEDIPLFYEDPDREVFKKTFNPANYRAIWEMHLKNGNPLIRDFNKLKNPLGSRSYYDNSTNEMVLQDPDHWIPELAHSQQFSQDRKKYDEQGQKDFEKFGLADTSNLIYNTPGTVEYDAHQVREPILYRQLDSLRNVFGGRNRLVKNWQQGGPAGIGFSNLAKKLFGNNNTKEPEASKEYQQWINSDPRILKSEINTKLIGDLINQKSAIRSEDFYTDKDETIPLTEGYLRGAKLPVKLVKKAKKVGDKYGVDPLDILAIAAKESTFGYSPFAEERWGSSKDHRAKTMDFENGISEQGIFTFNDVIFGYKPIPYPEFLYRKGDKRINPIKTFHGYEYDFDEDTALDIYSEDKNVKDYIKYLEKYQPKKVDIMEEVAKRIKEKGIAAYNPGQKNYAEMVEKYKKLLMNNKTPIKFQQGGYASFLMPSSHLTPEFSQQGFNYYFNDPLMVPEAKGGGFFGKLWGGIKKGLGAVGDQTLSFLGMPDVIKNSAYDTGAPNWLKKANSFIGNAATGIASAAIPGAGIAFNGLRGLVNNIGGGSNPGAGNIGGGGLGFLSGLNFNEPAYNSGSMLTGLNPFANMGGGNMGMFGNTGSFGTALGRLNVSLNGPGPFGGIGGGLFGGTPTFTGSPMQPRMYQEGGVVQEEAPQMIPIQTEKDEYLIHLDNAITPVNATKLHKKMDDDEVTDIVPEGTYVASNDKKIYMTKKQAEEIVMGLKSKSYEEFKKGMIPEKILFSEIFGKDKKLTPAELAERILKKFPTIDKNTTFNKSDIFTEITNEENMMARTPWLQQLVAFNESKRMGTPEGSFKKGGPVLKMKDVVSIPSTGGRVQKFGPGGNTDWGSIIGTAASALPFVADLFGANKGSEIDPMARNLIYGSAPLHALGLSQNINAQRNAFGQAIQDYTGLGQNLNQFAMGTAGANIAGRMMQDTNFQRFDPLAQQTRLANFNTRTPQSFVDALSTPRYDLNSLAATLGPRGFNTFAGQLAGQQMDTRNRAMMEQFNQDRNLGFNILGQQNALDSFSQQFNIGQAEKEMAAKNAQTAGVFGDIGSLFNRFGDIQSNILPATTQFNLQRANLSGQLPLGIAQNMLNMGSIMATTANGQPQKNAKSGSGQNYEYLKNIMLGSNQNMGNPIANNFSQIGNMIGGLFPGLKPAPSYGPAPQYDPFGNLIII